jgi:hypothetical protein
MSEIATVSLAACSRMVLSWPHSEMSSSPVTAGPSNTPTTSATSGVESRLRFRGSESSPSTSTKSPTVSRAMLSGSNPDHPPRKPDTFPPDRAAKRYAPPPLPGNSKIAVLGESTCSLL